jgi:NhaA family Na+:H+ antiporter
MLLWVAVYFSGLHATLAGVLVAATIPTRRKASLRPLLAQEAASVRQSRRQIFRNQDREGEERRRLANRMQVIERRLNPPAERLEHALQPWSSYFVLPIFALANAGIAISPQSTSLSGPASLGIVLGLVLGKPLGIGLATWLVHQTGLGEKPEDATWRQIIGVGWLCGIGFTMSIFISTEAFAAGEQLASAKFAVMIGSVVSAIAGVLWLRLFCDDTAWKVQQS